MPYTLCPKRTWCYWERLYLRQSLPKLSKILIWALIWSLIKAHKFRRGSIATPSPPHATALTAIKFLPLATVRLSIYWRSPINPDTQRIRASSTALGTAKLSSVNRRRSPFGRMWSKSFHVLEILIKLLVVNCLRLSRLLPTVKLTEKQILKLKSIIISLVYFKPLPVPDRHIYTGIVQLLRPIKGGYCLTPARDRITLLLSA